MSIKERLIAADTPFPNQNFTAADRANLLEVLQRSRRIETRLTRLLETEGIQTGIQRPWWQDDRVMLPSPMTTLDAILRTIPDNWPNTVQLVLKEDQRLRVLCRILL